MSLVAALCSAYQSVVSTPATIGNIGHRFFVTSQTKPKNKSMFIAWKEIPRFILPKAIYCPSTNTKEFTNKS
ncbi:hypothetical protein B5X24_HaOG209098 [Helicoverpa armigera]|nr:hypothetical protein B5X24_HaOG209098 [Helicoverpa armigera]